MQKKFLSFDPAVDQPELLRAWKYFVKTGKINSSVVPMEIAASWKRSRQAGVDPFDFHTNSYLRPEELQRRVKRQIHLIEIARPILESIYNSLEKTRYLVVLYDTEGYHLLRIGKRKDFRRSLQFKIWEGLCFEERCVGTSGFSLAKHLQKAIQIIGCEHYSSLLHYVTGSYAPILNPNKREMIGVVGVTGAKTPPNDHTQAIVIAAATAIENLLRLDKSRQDHFVLAKSLQIAIDALEDGVIVFNKDNRIVEINSIAKRIFRLTDFTDLHISDLMEFEDIYQVAVQCLESKSQAPKEINCQIDRRMYLASIKLLQNNKQEVQGLVVHLKNVKKITQIFQNIAGETPHYNLGNIVASSKVMADILQVIQVASKTDACVIIEGESGSGKEVAAQCIHNESSRQNKPFVVINCAAIPHELLESTLFGHEKGAFTGADTTHLGKFEIADQGTLFLDEIGEMSPAMQAKMLRAIETGTIERVGGKKPFPVDVRIIAATNRDLYKLIRNNQFRADLFYRLNVFRICLPPLRERKDDIPLLIETFLYKFVPVFKIPVPKVSKSYLKALQKFDWPGNVRELKNAVQYSLARLYDKDELTADHLNGFFPPSNDENGLKGVEMKDNDLYSIEKQVILRTLDNYNGNKTLAAQKLGISRATLYRKLRQ